MSRIEQLIVERLERLGQRSDAFALYVFKRAELWEFFDSKVRFQ